MDFLISRSALALAILAAGVSCKQQAKASSSNSGFLSHKSEGGSREPAALDFRPEEQFKTSAGRTLVMKFRSAQSELPKAKDQLLLFARCGSPETNGPERLERVKDSESWPDDCLEMYVFLLDGFRQIRLMQIVPNSESGDWYEQQDFLFGPEGKLRYWERYFGSFNPDEPTKSWHAFAWSDNGSAIDHATQFLDPEGRPWNGREPKAPPRPPLSLRTLLDQLKLTRPLQATKVNVPAKVIP